MTTLTEFLLARVAEDEAVAQEPNRGDYSYDVAANREIWADADRVRIGVGRLLSECEGKRRVVAEHAPRWFVTFADGRALDSGGMCGTCQQGGDRVTWPCLTLRALAAIYANHPDYRDEWAL